MKQLTLLDSFQLSLGHGDRRRRRQNLLKPEGAWLPIDLDVLDVMVELDPGMVDWETGLLLQVARS